MHICTVDTVLSVSTPISFLHLSLESEQEFRSQQFEKVIKDKSKKISDLEMEVCTYSVYTHVYVCTYTVYSLLYTHNMFIRIYSTYMCSYVRLYSDNTFIPFH